MILRLLFCLTIFLCGCRQSEPEKHPEPTVVVGQEFSCRDCHAHSLDSHHNQLACTSCHGGQSPTKNADSAHQDIIRRPAHPKNMEQNCGHCHRQEIHAAQQSAHFTLADETNTVRRAFGADEHLASLLDIPQQEEITSALDLVDDMLRRRCLRCHVYYQGDDYPQTVHGTGCAACHLDFSQGKPASHAFVKSPPDSQCLHCHQGNFVGADYYGRYEHDHHWDYRTPYTPTGTTSRPYGVEYHQLSADIHQLAGLACIDCHSGMELMTDSPQKISCQSCHGLATDAPLPLNNLHRENGQIILTTKHDGSTHLVPQLNHPAHKKYEKQAHCTVCHAGWAFTDEGTHLFRLDPEEFDPWGALYVQGSSEVEEQIYTSLYREESYPVVFMSDKITNELYTGIWLKGFELRRWEFPIICKDSQGILHICRPLLDLHLSYIDDEEKLIFDAITPDNAPAMGLLPYTPHTIGKAGAFYQQRLQENIHLLQQPLNLKK